MTDTLNGQKPSDADQIHTTDLKNKFKARSIPLEQDFHDLIDVADAGRLAAGLSPMQASTKGSARTGLIIDADKRLAVKPKIDGGLDVAADGVSVKKGKGIDTSADEVAVKAKTDGGLIVAADGVSVKKGNGIDTSVDAVTVKVKTGGGLIVESDGVSVKKGNGIDTSVDAVTVKVKTGGGLIVESDGVSVKKGDGIDTGADGVSVKVASKRGISVTGDGLALNPDETLIFNSSGQVAVSDVFLRNTGNCSITGGNLSISSDGNGVEFMGGGKIIKIVGNTVCWHKESSGARPKICDHDGSNKQDIATLADLEGLRAGLKQGDVTTADMKDFIWRVKAVMQDLNSQYGGNSGGFAQQWAQYFADSKW